MAGRLLRGSLLALLATAALSPSALGADETASGARLTTARQAAYELLADRIGQVVRVRTSAAGSSPAGCTASWRTAWRS